MKPDAKLMAAILSAINAYLAAERRPLPSPNPPVPGPSYLKRQA